MREWPPDSHVIVIGTDYHLGDLLWLTGVLRQYRCQVRPRHLYVVCPDRPISRILENLPFVDEVIYGEQATVRAIGASRGLAVVRDVRPRALAVGMVRDFRRRAPWLYYRDLWLEPRGQWLATYLGLGPLSDTRPALMLSEADLRTAGSLRSPYIALAPHIGSYSLPVAGRVWRRIKTWPAECWSALAAQLREQGFATVTLSAGGQPPIPGTTALMNLPIRQAAGVLDRAAALVTVESGLWFVAAAREVPFVIVPWWLPRSVDWPAPMNVPYRLVRREEASTGYVLACVTELVRQLGSPARQEPKAPAIPGQSPLAV